MDDSQLKTIDDVKELIKVESKIKFQAVNKKEKYQWLENVINKFRYFRLKKKERGMIRAYIKQMINLSEAQITVLINRKKKLGKIFQFNQSRHRFSKIYTIEDVALLTATDNAHDRLSGPATKEILRREYQIFENNGYEKLSQISVAHIYNLRSTRQYLSNTLFWKKTKPTPVNIGERRKPDPQNRPGFIRVDTVHQGDCDKEKGVYHVNFTDEVTQWELVACVEKISEQYLKPILELVISQFPFLIINFHSDNGSEYINKIVAQLLNKLLIKQTKSRARHCNDNALAECKNGWVIRKLMGRNFIAQKFAPTINQFYQTYLNVYLNFHRPCGFATTVIDRKGKEKKVYKTYLTPYEKLRSLPNAEKYLKPIINFKYLNQIAKEKSDNEFAALMQKNKVELFKNFRQSIQLPTIYSTPISCLSLD